MGITGVRRLIFGLFSIACVSTVEILTEGWTKPGAASIVLIAMWFYGERLVTSAVELVKAWRGKNG